MTQPTLTITIPGKPRGQGSITLWRANDGTERAKHAPDTINHRNLAIGLLRQAHQGKPPHTGPIAVRICAELPRPKNHYRTGRNAGILKETAPLWATTYPDLDKIARLIGDALTIAGIILDDSQIVIWRAEKRYATGAPQTRVEVHHLG